MPRLVDAPHNGPRPQQHFIDLENLENDITELAAHINAATYRLFELICLYDEKEGWAQHGLASCAHWLQWQCGTNLNAAREKVRVARALPDLPEISEAFRTGRVSYSKVRAMTRVATPANEAVLLNVARHGTAAHVEKMVRNYRRHQRWEMLEKENHRHTRRELSCYVDDDGSWVFRGRFTAEQGALISKALEKALDEQFAEQEPGMEQTLQENTLPPKTDPESFATRRADALERVAESFLAGSKGEHSGGDRYLVNIHTEPEVLKADGDGVESECENRSHVSAETSRRMSCDCSVVHWREVENGEPLSIGRKSRSIPPALRRALQRRDGGCRFPGCSCRRFVDAHHIRHWADGGETSMNNLVLLCRRHHRLVHEGGFGVHAEAGGEFWFSYPNREKLAISTDGRFRGNVDFVKVQNIHNGLDITAGTLPPVWHGEEMDYDLAQLGLQSCE